jgi:NADH-quinone oxidoreductase subunit H
MHARARRLGGDPGQRRLGNRRHQRRRALHLRDLVADGLRHHHGGWASNSKYAFLSAIRSAAQMVSYEVSIGFVIITVLLCAGSLKLSAIVAAQDTQYGMFGWYWLPLLPMFVVFYVSALAETNRPPFDLVEAESELVAGFMVEYGSSPYMMFMLGEYVAIATMCAMATILFLGGWLPRSRSFRSPGCRA